MGKKSKKILLEEQIEKEKTYNFIQRGYVYQKERFPIIIFGFYVLCVAIGVFFITDHYVLDEIAKQDSRIFNMEYARNYYKLIPMFIVGILQFFMVRIVDEFKDYEEDCKYRAYRPVPRGLVKLKTLKILFIICAIIQLSVVFFCKGSILLLVILWCAFLLLTQDFFIKDFLDRHILVGVLFDEILMPILALLMASFCTNEKALIYLIGNTGLIYMIYLTYVISWIVEFARKIRCKKDEEKGVKTYSAVLGIPKAILILGVLELFVYMLQLEILNRNYEYDCLTVYFIVIAINILFVITENKFFSKLVELSANLYISFAYLSFIVLAFPI